MNVAKRTLLAFLATVSGAVAYHPTTQEMQHLMSQAAAARQADFSLKGVVVDEEGSKVAGVTMVIEEGHSSKGGTEKDYASRTETVNGDFAVEAKQRNSLRLFLGKQGYHNEVVEFSSRDALPANWRERMAKGEKLKPGKVQRDDIRIVLRKHGKLVVLKDVSDDVTFQPAGPCTVWDLAFKDWRAITQVKGVADESLLPQSCIYLRADVTNGGRLALANVVGPEGARQPCPEKLRLVMKGDGGFVAVPTLWKKLDRQYQSMIEAPEKGYVRELVMDSAAIEKHLRSDSGDGTRDGAFFYFRAGKEYGKGGLYVQFTRGDKVTVRLSLRFQPDGSRGLETDN